MDILVVDDKETVLASVTDTLITCGYDVDAAYNGLAALEKSTCRIYDLFIVDHLMPIMNGINFVKNLRKIECYALTPIIFMTTKGIDSVRLEYNSGLFSAVIDKPLNNEKLLNLINHFQNSNTRTITL